MNFDLTDENGRKRVLEFLEKYGWMYAPQFWIAKKVSDWITSPSTKTIEEQKEAAIELIKAGRENNVEEMKITLDQTVGIDIGSSVDGIPIRAKVGKSGKMKLEVKYKNS